MYKIIDLSQEICDNMPVYPGDGITSLTQTNYIDIDKYNSYCLNSGMHAGTHVDSPMHLSSSKRYISELPAEGFIGSGSLLNVSGQQTIGMKPEYEAIVQPDSIALLYTGYDKFYGSKKYYEEHPCMDIELCDFLISRKIKMVGMDTPSPDRLPYTVHKKLCDSGIYILENLTNLDKLDGIQSFEVMALPLKIKADSSMVRAVARIL